MKKPISFATGVIIAVLLQTLALAWMVFDRNRILTTGETVKLTVQPVDPRDLFRGDFVILRYDISWLGPNTVANVGTYRRNDPIYVELAKTEQGLWKAVAAHKSHTRSKEAHIVIRGRVANVNSQRPRIPGDNAEDPDCPAPCRGLRVRYGLENYFVPEGEGKALEDMRNNKKVEILAAVSGGGNAAIKAIIVDGQSAYVEPLL
ncbi:MAG: GDYXXLXY domain-containing protein [Methyloligellaceae bacterium]